MTPLPAIIPPRQKRTREAWGRVLDAGVALLEEGGAEALTIAALCARAEVSPPTIYARAANKELLVLAVYEHAIGQISASDELQPQDPHWADMDDAQRVGEAIGQLARMWLSNARLLRALVLSSARNEEIRRRGSLYSIDQAQRFRKVLLAGGKATAARERRADACFRMAYGALAHRVTYGASFESDVPLSDDDFVTALRDSATTYFNQTQEQ